MIIKEVVRKHETWDDVIYQNLYEIQIHKDMLINFILLEFYFAVYTLVQAFLPCQSQKCNSFLCGCSCDGHRAAPSLSSLLLIACKHGICPTLTQNTFNSIFN